jgi:glucose-6-phosphate isomerase
MSSEFVPVFTDPKTGFRLDVSGMKVSAKALAALTKAPKSGTSLLQKAMEGMRQIEAGAIKNPDEGRKVTHFSDRLTYCKSPLFKQIEAFAAKIRSEPVLPGKKKCEYLIVNGIGGSALGPQLMQLVGNGPYWNELPRARRQAPRLYFLDNTDAAGVTDALQVVELDKTVLLTISKSGGTQETANNTIAMQAAYKKAGLDFAKYAVAVTMEGSKLDKIAKAEKWLAIFPMAESIGGRTSETNIVGHVPATFTGIDFKKFVDGARYMDELTRNESLSGNPAMLLAAMWYIAGEGKGNRNMVIVPYADHLVLFSRYLQQLVMESIGKEFDLAGKPVYQGLNVFGNKGGTDAHAFIQQLNDGRDDFFATFIEVLKDSENIPVADGITIGDYLHGFKAGLVAALRGKGRQTIEITIGELDVFTLGMLIALYERAVAIYAEFVNINAFHQPGVQAYKLAAGSVNDVATKLRAWIAKNPAWKGDAVKAAKAIGCAGQETVVDGILAKYAANKRAFGGVKVTMAWKGTTRIFALAK